MGLGSGHETEMADGLRARSDRSHPNRGLASVRFAGTRKRSLRSSGLLISASALSVLQRELCRERVFGGPLQTGVGSSDGWHVCIETDRQLDTIPRRVG